MATLGEVRISELPGADPLDGTEIIPLVQDGVTKSRSAQSLVLDGGLQAHLDAADPHSQYAFRVLNNLTATGDPTVNNDSSEGYSVLSKWLNNSSTEVWLCLDATVGAAVWEIKTLTTDDLGSAALADVGAGNGLDADLLDAQEGTYYLDFPNFTNLPDPILTLDGDVSGVATFTDLGNATLTVEVEDDSHNHAIANVDGLPVLVTKLNNIESNATSDQTDSEIKIAYEANADTNEFSDSEQTKLSNIEANATADQTNSEIKIAYEANADTNEFSDAEQSKLLGIEAGAEVNVGTDVGVVYNAGDIVVTSTTGTDATVDAATITQAGVLSSSDKSKLDNIESNATSDQTDSEIKIAYEANLDTNEFSDAEQTKLSNIEANATADQTKIDIDALNIDADTLDGIDSTGFATSAQGDTADSALQSSDIGVSVQAHDTVLDNTTASYTTAEETKLSNIEANATADQTNSEIKSAYEANADTNEFSDSEQTKLSNIEANATADQTNSEIKIAYEANVDTNEFSDAEQSKLLGIEAGAEVNTVDSVNSKTGAVTITQTDVGLSNVDNTSDVNKPVSTAQQSALDLKIPLTQRASINGVATLDSNGKIPLGQINSSITGQITYLGLWNADTNTPTLTQGAASANGNFYVTNVAGTFDTVSYGLGDWIISDGTNWENVPQSSAVQSVSGRTGIIVLTKTDVGLANVQNVDQTNATNLTSGTLPAARFNNTAHGNRAGGALHANATTSVAGFLTGADKTKLNSVDTGAQANTVTSVNTKTGAVVLSTTDVEEGSRLYHTALRAANAAPVQSVDGFTGIVDLSATYDKYTGWTLLTNGTSRGDITSGESVNFVAGTNMSLSYSATNNAITFNSTDTNYYLSDLGFNTTDGVLTATINGATNKTVDLDGRYLLEGAKAVDSDKLDGLDSTGFATSAQGDTADSALQSSDIGISVQAHDTVLDNTTASYTTAEETKLSGIEDGATAGGGDWTIQDLDHNEYASLYSNSAGTEGVRVEYNASSKSLDYNFF